MSNPRRQIFRPSAMRHYLEQREQDILPRVVAPPVFIFAWLLLALLLIIIFLAWSIEIPTFTSAPGAVLAARSTANNSSDAQAVIFFSSSLARQLKAGLPVQVQIGTSGSKISSVIERIDSGVLSPEAARARYALREAAAQTLTSPSIAVLVTLKNIAASTFAGSEVTAQMQIGESSLISNLFS